MKNYLKAPIDAVWQSGAIAVNQTAVTESPGGANFTKGPPSSPPSPPPHNQRRETRIPMRSDRHPTYRPTTNLTYLSLLIYHNLSLTTNQPPTLPYPPLVHVDGFWEPATAKLQPFGFRNICSWTVRRSPDYFTIKRRTDQHSIDWDKKDISISGRPLQILENIGRTQAGMEACSYQMIRNLLILR